MTTNQTPSPLSALHGKPSKSDKTIGHQGDVWTRPLGEKPLPPVKNRLGSARHRATAQMEQLEGV